MTNLYGVWEKYGKYLSHWKIIIIIIFFLVSRLCFLELYSGFVTVAEAELSVRVTAH